MFALGAAGDAAPAELGAGAVAGVPCVALPALRPD